MFICGDLYSRREIKSIIGLPDNQVQSNFNFFSFGYPLVADTFYIFANISIPGTTGHEYPDHLEGQEYFVWSAIDSSSITQPKIKKLLSNSYRKLLFVRVDLLNRFEFVGILTVRDILSESFPTKIRFFVNRIDFRFQKETYYLDQDDVEAKIGKEYSGQELWSKIQDAGISSNRIFTNTCLFQRNNYLSAYVKKRAKGICELCKKPAPFFSLSGEPYLEVHHIISLSDGGVDRIFNSIALCPNCHRELHYGTLSKEKYNEVIKVLYQALMDDDNMNQHVLNDFSKYHQFSNSGSIEL